MIRTCMTCKDGHRWLEDLPCSTCTWTKVNYSKWRPIPSNKGSLKHWLAWIAITIILMGIMLIV